MRIFLLLLLVSFEARAFVRSQDPASGACLFWPKREISWWLNEKGSDDVSMEELQAALQRSFNAWEDEDCSDIRFKAEGLSPRVEVGYDDKRHDNLNLVIFREQSCDEVVPAGDRCFGAGDCADVYDCWEHSTGIIAQTLVNYSRRMGTVVDADIEFNGAPNERGESLRFTATEGTNACADLLETDCVSTDIENTATHEVGHLLGLDHSPEPAATMFATAPPGETLKRSLHPDDLAGLCEVYPAGRPPRTCTPSGSITITPAPQGCGCGASGGWLGLLGLLALARRARR